MELCPMGRPYLERACFFCKFYRPEINKCHHPGVAQRKFVFEENELKTQDSPDYNPGIGKEDPI